VWDAATPEAREQVDVDRVVNEVVSRFMPAIEAALAEAGETFLQQWGPILAVIGAILVSETALAGAVRVAQLGLIRWLIGRYQRDARRRATPNGVVRDALIAAGGGQESGGELVRDAAGHPVTVDGGAWTGNPSWFAGHRTVSRLPDGWEYEWVHGMFGVPGNPFEPHVMLDGTRFRSYAEVAPWFPSDHQGCTCGVRVVFP
jgi:hypothetical protein